MNCLKQMVVLSCLLILLAVSGSNSSTAATNDQLSLTFDCADVTHIPQIECEALVALYQATDGDNWRLKSGWLVNNNPCVWYGVVCTDGQVSRLNLGSNYLTGAIPPEIGDLTNLTWFELFANSLTALPPEIGELTNLTRLDLSMNQLTAVPAELGNLSNLTMLFLDSNWLTALPPEIGNLASLNYLTLTGNRLTALPPEIGNMTNLIYFFVSGNRLTTIPPEIGGLTGLAALGLDRNQLTTLPPELGNLTGLVWLYLYSNQLTALPPEIGNLTNLTRLELQTNQLTAIPPEIGNLVGLTILYLHENQLTTLPSEIGNLVNLDRLYLYDNWLMVLPPEIGNLTSLTRLSLYRNHLTAVPPEIGNLTNLIYLRLDSNQLTTLPAEIGNLTELFWFHVDNNFLTAVPPEIGNLTKVQYLLLQNNQLTAVPPEMGNLASIQNLHLNNNNLAALPTELGNLTSVRFFQLQNNPLSGPLPSWLTALAPQGFYFYTTEWCIPDDPEIQEWLDNRSEVMGTGLVCDQPSGGLSGIVTDDQGIPLAGVQVVLYRQVWPPPTNVVDSAYTDEAGQYSFANLGQEINYRLHFQDMSGSYASEYYNGKSTIASADPVTITLGLTRTANAQLKLPHEPLILASLSDDSATASIDPVNGRVYVNMPAGGTADLTLAYAATCEDESAPAAVVLRQHATNYPMTLDAGLYTATIPAEALLSGHMTVTITCDSGNNTEFLGSVNVYEPNGAVAHTNFNQPVAGAKVSLYYVPGWIPRTGPLDNRPNTCESSRSRPAGAGWSQPAPVEKGILTHPEAFFGSSAFTLFPAINYQYSNNDGFFGWDLFEGCWYVIVEVDGLEPVVSPVVGAFPTIANLNLFLAPSELWQLYLPVMLSNIDL
jgi:Leucine-rich repeat (LRR) protein